MCKLSCFCLLVCFAFVAKGSQDFMHFMNVPMQLSMIKNGTRAMPLLCSALKGPSHKGSHSLCWWRSYTYMSPLVNMEILVHCQCFF